MKTSLFALISLLPYLCNGQHLSIGKLLAIRTESADSIQGILLGDGYNLYNTTDSKDGEIASGSMKYSFIKKVGAKTLKYYVTFFSSPNLHEMYNSNNTIIVEFNDVNFYSLYRTEIMSNDLILVKTAYKNNNTIYYFYKQTGNYKIQGEFIVLTTYSAKSLTKGKASTFSLEITTPLKCPKCLEYAMEH